MQGRIKKKPLTRDQLESQNRLLKAENEELKLGYGILNDKLNQYKKDIYHMQKYHLKPLSEITTAQNNAITDLKKRLKTRLARAKLLEANAEKVRRILTEKKQRGSLIWKKMFGVDGKEGKKCKYCDEFIAHSMKICRVLSHIHQCKKISQQLKNEYADMALLKNRSKDTAAIANKIKNVSNN